MPNQGTNARSKKRKSTDATTDVESLVLAVAPIIVKRLLHYVFNKRLLIFHVEPSICLLFYLFFPITLHLHSSHSFAGYMLPVFL